MPCLLTGDHKVDSQSVQHNLQTRQSTLLSSVTTVSMLASPTLKTYETLSTCRTLHAGGT